MSARRLRLAVAIVGLVLFGACGGAGPVASPVPVAATQAIPIVAPPGGAPVPTKGAPAKDDTAARARAIAAARTAIQQAVTGAEREDLLSLLQSAEVVVDSGEAYQAFLGTWQYMRVIFKTEGERAEHRAVLDALREICRSFASYQATHFEVTK
ncbi:MAG: hypothetical protein FJ033_12275 [Chloroflexi bacterium]|nr:hypothetical protein [Chloroflexota bacterium]